MWENLSEIWKAAFEEAWEAFKSGSIPIGAVITDENGNIILKDHNRSNETGVINRSISHAEANALRSLDTSEYNPKSLTLYSTMEPCPMCFGTAVMANIKRLRYAARDPHCGFVHIKDEDDYLRSKNLDYRFENDEKEIVQLTIQSYHELRYISMGAGDGVLNKFRLLNGKAVSIAERLFAEKKLDSFAESGKSFGAVYDFIVSVE